MRKLVLLGVVALLVSGSSAHADDAQVACITSLHKHAQTPNPFLLSRTAAVDDLGNIRPTDQGSLARLKEVFQDLLNNPKKVDPYEKNFFLLHVVQALGKGNVGPDACDLLLDLDKAISNETILNNAILDAKAKIRASSSPLPGKEPQKPSPPDVDALLKTLAEDKEPANRLSAAKLLGKVSGAADVAKVLPKLLPKMQDDDSDVRRVVAGSAKTLLISATSASDYAKWTQGYVDGLAFMLGEKNDPSERIFAALAFRDPAVSSVAVPRALITAAGSAEKDKDVQCVAGNTLKLIQGGTK